jgi:hypothetical protein
MIGPLIDGAIKRRKVVLGVTLIAALFGFFAYLSMPRESNPDIDLPYISVIVPYPGVSPEDAERLFQPFYRGRASRSTGVAGVGLGLAISRVLVQRQGGRISLDAKVERGAAFSLHLPRARASRLTHEDELPPTSSSAGLPRAARTRDRD